MKIQDKIIINKRRINWAYLSTVALIHPKLRSRLNLSKAAVVLIAMALTAVTMTSNVAAAGAESRNTTDVESTVLSMHVQAEESSAEISAFLNIAAEQIGKPYVFGRTGPKSFDCSGLVYYCLNQAGLSVDRTTASGFSKENDWEKISSMDDLKPGDILFFSTGGKKVGHTGIYIGDGKMIDASSSSGEVVQRSCITSYWKNHFVFARRPFSV